MARITEITVSAGRTVPHPSQTFSNLRPQLTLKATLDENDSAEAVTKELQARAESMVEDHKNHMITAIRELEEMQFKHKEISSLKRQIEGAQQRLDQLREGAAALPRHDDDETVHDAVDRAIRRHGIDRF